GAGLGHDEQILEPAAAEAGPVETGLDREDLAALQLFVPDHAEHGQLVHLEADAVAERMEEALLERLPLALRALRRIAGRPAARTVGEERLRDRSLDPLGGERLPIHFQPHPVLLGTAQELARGGHPGLRRSLGAADARELRVAFHAPALDEEALVGHEINASG